MRFSPKAGLWLILVVSLGLRVWLAAGGGQGYWPDENIRYGESRAAAYHLLHGEWAGLKHELLGHADHLLFRWVALPAAILDEWQGTNAFRAACYFSLFSTAVIALVWGLVKRAGGGEREALLAALLAACAGSLFFYARHFFPYDAALMLLLAGLWVGLGGTAVWRCVAAGLLAGAGFLTYNGYWLLAVVVAVLVVLRPGTGWVRLAGRAALTGAGLVGCIAGMVVLARSAGHDLVHTWRANAGTITQGDFRQGWRVVVEYLWFTEGPLALAWGVAVGAAVWLGWRTRDSALLRWLGAGLLLVAGLVVLSDWLHKFVVYGRLVRPLVPFLCLLTARVVLLGEARARWSGWTGRIITLLAVGCAVWNFSTPLRQVFPAEFLAEARAEAMHELRGRPGVVRVLFAEHLWGSKLDPDLPVHTVIARASHPLQYRPYQYEGFSTEQRAEFVRHDITMRLISLTGLDLEPGTGGDFAPPPYPGPIRLRVKFPADAVGRCEPLVTTGSTGRGDFVYVRYEAGNRVRFGLDHWGVGAMQSEALPIDPTREHEVLISLGSLLPEDFGAGAALWREKLRRLAFVALDGKPVLSVGQNLHPSTLGEVFIGSNFIGGSVVQREFTGTVTGVGQVSFSELGRLLPFARLAMADRGMEWQEAVGPWRFRLRLPQSGEGESEPLFSVLAGDRGEWLVMEEVDATHIRLRVERGDGVYRSPPIEVDRAESHEVVFSCGSLYPADTSQLFQMHPAWLPLKRLTHVAWNGRTVFLRHFEPVTEAAREAGLGVRLGVGVVAREHYSGLIEEMTPVEPDEILRASCQLSDLGEARPAEWLGYAGPVRMRLRLPQEFPAPGVGEPLIVGGITGAGDFLAVFYGTDGEVRIGFDHWSAENLPKTEPIRIMPGEECELLLSAGFLWPPAEAALYRENPALRGLRERVIVEVNGRRVLDVAGLSHAAAPESLTVGGNFIGGSTTAKSFTGVIEKVEAAEIGSLLRSPSR